MILPDDAAIAFRNLLGTFAVIFFCFMCAHVLILTGFTSGLHIVVACLCLYCGCVSVISNFGHTQTSENVTFQAFARRSLWYVLGAIVLGVIVLFGLASTAAQRASSDTVTQLTATSGLAQPASVYSGPSLSCLSSLSKGQWVSSDCSSTVSGKVAFCERAEWSWGTSAGAGVAAPVDNSCPVGHIQTAKALSVFSNKRIVFAGDGAMRNVYHEFNVMLDPQYQPDNVTSVLGAAAKPGKAVSMGTLRHSDLEFSLASHNVSVEFYWTPFVQNITKLLNSPSASVVKVRIYKGYFVAYFSLCCCGRCVVCRPGSPRSRDVERSIYSQHR
jgi:hypothetical protein